MTVTVPIEHNNRFNLNGKYDAGGWKVKKKYISLGKVSRK